MHSIITLDLAHQRVDHAARAAEQRTARGPIRPQASLRARLTARVMRMMGMPWATHTSVQTQTCC